MWDEKGRGHACGMFGGLHGLLCGLSRGGVMNVGCVVDLMG